MDPRSIRQIAQYDVVDLIAEGGMSWVFEVVDHRLEVRRALKLLKPEAAAGMEFRRFEVEAQSLARLDHPNLVTIFDFGTDPGTGCLFYTMTLIDGCTLGQLGTLHPRRACEIVLDALSGLAAIHDAGIIHRDIKPGNILVSRDGRAQLADLGIARTAEEDLHLTRTGMMVGTVLFASPEHVRGQPVSRACDVFSMGLTLYKSITGESPYDNVEDIDTTSSQDVVMYLGSLVHSGSEFALSFPASIPEPIRRVILKACRLRPEDRYPDAHAMRAALGAALVECYGSHRPHRSRVGVAVALSVVALAAIGAYEVFVQGFDPFAQWSGGATPVPAEDTPGRAALVPERAAAPPVPAAREAGSPAPAPPARPEAEDPIQAILDRAREQLADDRLTLPAGDNALASYRAVLALRPDDPEAIAGLETIRARYLEWAERAEARDALDDAASYYDRALLAAPGDEEVARRRAALDARIARSREEPRPAAVPGRAEAAPAEDATAAPVETAAVAPPAASALVRVEAGDFRMGAGGATPATTGAFEIDRTEVTAGAYDACVSAGVCTPLPRDRACNGQAGRAEHPANCASFTQARTYCGWVGKRLPSGEEWEKAARGREGQPYAWGSAAPTCDLLVARARGCRTRGTEPVGSKLAGASPYGALDMLGNVWEWTRDEERGRPVLRGGAWNTRPVTTDHRYPYPDKGTPSTGFRCAR